MRLYEGTVGQSVAMGTCSSFKLEVCTNQELTNLLALNMFFNIVHIAEKKVSQISSIVAL